MRGEAAERLPSCLLADDHPALMLVLTRLLLENGFEVIGPAYDGHQAVALAREHRPDVALVDYRMPMLGGAALVASLRESVPDLRIAVYTADADETVVREALEAGAAGLLLKQAPLGDVVRAVRSVHAGHPYLDPALAASAVTDAAQAQEPRPTARELEVLALLAEGMSHREIADRLSISPETVRRHGRNAAGRLGATTRTQAVATALRDGLIS
jgi:DNA-binding NarL/FixJ family response regulator